MLIMSFGEPAGWLRMWCMRRASAWTGHAMVCVGGVMADGAATGAVLLVGDAHGGSGSLGESGEVCSIGNDGMVSCVEGHMTNPELLSALAVLAVVTGVFTNA